MKVSYLLLPLCFVAAVGQAAEEVKPLVCCSASESQSNTPQAVPYTYGTKLDIHKVISIQEPEDQLLCGVITAKMTYLDSTHKRRAISYLKMAKACDVG